MQIELALGKPETCLPLIRTERQRRPRDPRWVTYEAMAARQLGDPLYHRLYDYERLVRVYERQPPPGWASMAQINAAGFHAYIVVFRGLVVVHVSEGKRPDLSGLPKVGAR